MVVPIKQFIIIIKKKKIKKKKQCLLLQHEAVSHELNEQAELLTETF